MPDSAAPPRTVLEAFGVESEPQPLAGGTGRSWQAGELVLKPLDCAPAEIPWQAELFGRIREDGFRVARPLPLVVDGWTAWGYLEGRHERGRWRDIIAVGERLHAALAAEPRPDAMIDPRTDPWAIGDRVAWGEAHYDGLEDVLSGLQPVDAPPQLIHGDLTGNVLFHDTLPPAVIDFSAYWRPAQYAAAIVVADALVWEGADESLAAEVEPQYLLRALIYRCVTSMVFDTEWLPTLNLARRIAVECASR